MLRAAPPRRKKRAFSTLPNCSLYVVKLLPDPRANTHYFYDNSWNRVNPPTFQKYIRPVNNSLRGFEPLRGLDKISAKIKNCTICATLRVPHPFFAFFAKKRVGGRLPGEPNAGKGSFSRAVIDKKRFRHRGGRAAPNNSHANISL